MRTVYKYKLTAGENELKLPKGYQVLSVINQFDNIMLYCLVESEDEDSLDTTKVQVVGTGWEAPRGCKFIGTVTTLDGALVWHVFVRDN